MDQIVSVLLVVLGIAVLWTVLKFAIKLGLKIFTCGLLVILAVAVVVVLLGNANMAGF
jgi:hypothetical protein